MKISGRLYILCIFDLFIFTAITLAGNYDLPVRVIAIADIQQLEYDKYAVRELLDVHNDDYNQPLFVKSILADTWRGHQKHQQNENWLEGHEIEIPPGEVRRVAERKRIVSGRKGRNWWVRWIRFNIETNRGNFFSNFVASPFKAPEKVEIELPKAKIDSLTEPANLTPRQELEHQFKD